MIHNIGQQHSVFNSFVAELRDYEIQRDAMRFRRNLERIGEVMAYEISKKLPSHEQVITTPLGEQPMKLIKDQPVIATILRAGLPLHQGLLNYFDRADSAFVSAYRKHKNAEDYDIKVEYLAAPGIDKRDLIICDPMLATGNSMVMVYKAILSHGMPRSIHIVATVATQEAIDFVRRHLPDTAQIWVAAIDNELTAQSYIVPGLGDAGDLAFGQKI
jgi:uracil phosphoribosyltransferase